MKKAAHSLIAVNENGMANVTSVAINRIWLWVKVNSRTNSMMNNTYAKCQNFCTWAFVSYAQSYTNNDE